MIDQSTESSIRRRFTQPLMMVAFVAFFGSPTDLSAITFHINYNAGNSTPPPEDLTGALLTSHMQAASMPSGATSRFLPTSIQISPAIW